MSCVHCRNSINHPLRLEGEAAGETAGAGSAAGLGEARGEGRAAGGCGGRGRALTTAEEVTEVGEAGGEEVVEEATGARAATVTAEARELALHVNGGSTGGSGSRGLALFTAKATLAAARETGEASGGSAAGGGREATTGEATAGEATAREATAREATAREAGEAGGSTSGRSTSGSAGREAGEAGGGRLFTTEAGEAGEAAKASELGSGEGAAHHADGSNSRVLHCES
ncbi:uncharacterized protein BDV17DRAFT_137734 [Aspergillus undulatus]|uniref:uncharacterized protein n=1 Tax=Aspergillus undulatus TaxID=1810928 RepID=UPI003CCDEBCE